MFLTLWVQHAWAQDAPAPEPPAPEPPAPEAQEAPAPEPAPENPAQPASEQPPSAQTPDPEPQADDLEDPEVVVVTGTRTEHALGDSPIATEVIDRQTIEQSGATSAADLLERAPGIQVTRGAFGSSIALQGLDPTHTLVLIDGQRMIGRKDGVIDLSRISAERIERIEIVKGPGSTMYGSDAMGGVVNIITRGAEDPQFSADVRYGQLGTFDAGGTYEGTPGRLSTLTTIGLHKQDAYDLDPKTAATDGVAFDALEGSERFRIDPGPNVDIDGSVSYLTRGTSAIEEQQSGAQFTRNNRVEELQASIGQSLLIGEADKLRTALYLTVFRDQFFYDQLGSNREDVYEDNRQNLGELEVQYTRVLGPHVATAGVEGFLETYRSPRLGTGEGVRQRGAVFVQDEWSVVEDRLELLPGFRFDADSQFGTAPTPRLAAAYFAGEDVVVRASYGLGFRAPDFKELYLLFENPAAGYVVQGNPDLRPERSAGATLGLEVDRDRVSFALNGFRNDLKDLIIIDVLEQPGFSATQYYDYQNVALAWTMGVDGNVKLTPVDPLTLRLGGQLLATRDKASGDPLPGRPPYSATFGLRARVPDTGLGATVDGTWTAARPFYEDVDGDDVIDRVQSDPYVMLDARAYWTLRDGTEVYAGGENLLDAGDASFTQIKPRWFYFGFKTRVGAGRG